ncbi:MAG: acireductone synthase [Candidatus Obscuribacterales bacterium]|nr:acireductone synthase [Candidatus Obscuribacterales bacterium]
MIKVNAAALLLDIEGTISPVTYVVDVLFPFARSRFPDFLKDNWEKTSVLTACDLMARDAGQDNAEQWLKDLDSLEEKIGFIVDDLNKLMDLDIKATGLKELQGLIWKEAFEKGELESVVFPDLPGALERWKADGLQTAIYSSGSATAQRTFLEHTEFGNLADYFSGFFDTTVGAKKRPESYKLIASIIKMPEAEIVFMSDLVAELDAARDSGMQTVLLLRPGNIKQENNSHAAISNFNEIEIKASK